MTLFVTGEQCPSLCWVSVSGFWASVMLTQPLALFPWFELWE